MDHCISKIYIYQYMNHINHSLPINNQVLAFLVGKKKRTETRPLSSQVLMAGNFKFFFIVFLLLSPLLFSSSSMARPLNDVAVGNSIAEGIEVFFDGLSLDGIKTSGPSPGGKGHAFTDAVNPNSGPSEGGKGHAFTDAVNPNSGPSEGGKGHAFTDAVNPNSGPSEGGKGHSFSDVVTNSGPSSGGKGH
ncbi:hypothetical protein J1N35_035844 [Gossypium stocksii]|uniref:Uncharacterized protein n=1 Tax=Gossypium stocksii TaxID=47602 RepID=A0A9D3UVG2_9ROSI|nr:hypothetical protein J1N35_035844 [Gossypium stocksii]